MTSSTNNEQLAVLNRKILAAGEVLPAVQLQDGSMVQTGTVATMLHNVERFNAGERGAVEEELALSVPTLIKVGLFNLFPAEDWIAGDNPGRALVGRLAQEALRNAR